MSAPCHGALKGTNRFSRRDAGGLHRHLKPSNPNHLFVHVHHQSQPCMVDANAGFWPNSGFMQELAVPNGMSCSGGFQRVAVMASGFSLLQCRMQSTRILPVFKAYDLKRSKGDCCIRTSRGRKRAYLHSDIRSAVMPYDRITPLLMLQGCRMHGWPMRAVGMTSKHR